MNIDNYNVQYYIIILRTTRIRKLFVFIYLNSYTD